MRTESTLWAGNAGREVFALSYFTSFEAYVAALDQLSDEDLNGPERFPGLVERIPGWLPWRVIYDPTHYAEHGQTIKDAVESLKTGS